MKCYGSYELMHGLTAGGVLTWQGGTPINDLGGATLPGRRSFVRPRGSVGRTPATWWLDLKFGYTLGAESGAGRLRPTVTLDLYTVGSPQKVTEIDQVHFFSMDPNTGQQLYENPHFLQPISYQPPMAARLGLAVAF